MKVKEYFLDYGVVIIILIMWIYKTAKIVKQISVVIIITVAKPLCFCLPPPPPSLCLSFSLYLLLVLSFSIPPSNLELESAGGFCLLKQAFLTVAALSLFRGECWISLHLGSKSVENESLVLTKVS